MWRRLIPRSAGGLTLAACVLAGPVGMVALATRPVGPGDILAGLVMGATIGAPFYVVQRVHSWGADSGALYWGLLRKRKRPPSGEDGGRVDGDGWR